MSQYEVQKKREIRFTEEDFDPILEEYGINPNLLTEYQWSKFCDMFLSGTNWYEVSRIAAGELERGIMEGLW
jgi:hypothetical protein